MLSALISSERGQPAVPLARQLTHQRFVRPGPLVLGTALLKSPTPTEDRDRHVCYLRAAAPPGGQVVSVPPGSPCRHGGRTISSRAGARVRRMASEDSGRPVEPTVPPSPVHAHGEVEEPLEPLRRTMLPVLHRRHDGGEGLELEVLLAEDGVGPKERDDPVEEVIAVPYHVDE